MTARTRKDAASGAGSDSNGPDAEPEPGRAEGSFESSLSELEAIVDRLEGGDLPLEEALAAFEAGVALTRRCSQQLETAERRIEVLVREGASWVARPFAEPEETE